LNEPTTTNPSVHPRRGRDSYDNIEPWFDELAAVNATDPHREEVREQIIRLCLPLADHIARRFTGRGEQYEDLHQVACVGLVQAVDRYDVRRESSFLGFAIPTIMGEVRRHFRDHSWNVRVPRGTKETQARVGPAIETLTQRLGRMPRAREIAAELEVDPPLVTQALLAANAYNTDSLEAVPTDENDQLTASVASRLGAEEPCYQLTEDAMAVRPLIAALPEQQRQVLVMRFFDAMTQTQIAHRLGISQMQVSRILSRTLSTLRDQALADGPQPTTA
jgi:RNA polymerase sigma-B factor